MAVIRVKKNQNFTTMSNYHLRDTELSLKAKGMLSMFLSLPETWEFSVNGLTKICKEGRDTVLTTLQELETKGYVFRKQSRDENGKLGKMEYIIYESPEDRPQLEKPQSENPTTGKPITELPTTDKPMTDSPGQLNTNQSKTERIKDGEKKGSRHKYGQYGNVLLSDEEYEKLTNEFPHDYGKRIERLSEYMASTGKSYKNHLVTIRSWARRDAEKGAVKAKGSYSHDAYECSEEDSL